MTRKTEDVGEGTEPVALSVLNAIQSAYGCEEPF